VPLTQADTSRQVRTKDWTLHYEEAGAGLPVIMLHGSGPGATGWTNFSANLEPLAQRFHVYAVDMPGWGESDPCTVERLDHVDALLQFMDAVGLERAALIGNSMGGATALRTATEHRDRVSHLVTMGAPVNLQPKLFGPADGPSEGLKALFAAYADPSPQAMRRLVELMVFDKSFVTDALCRSRADAAAARPDHLRNLLAGLPHGAPVPSFARTDDLRNVQVPALLIHGRDDRVLHPEHALTLLAHLPDSRLVLLNRCGHWAMIEHAAEFNRLVTDFLLHT